MEEVAHEERSAYCSPRWEEGGTSELPVPHLAPQRLAAALSLQGGLPRA